MKTSGGFGETALKLVGVKVSRPNDPILRNRSTGVGKTEIALRLAPFIMQEGRLKDQLLLEEVKQKPQFLGQELLKEVKQKSQFLGQELRKYGLQKFQTLLDDNKDTEKILEDDKSVLGKINKANVLRIRVARLIKASRRSINEPPHNSVLN